jgi:WD40 repeat protein
MITNPSFGTLVPTNKSERFRDIEITLTLPPFRLTAARRLPPVWTRRQESGTQKQEIISLEHNASVRLASFHPEGKRLVTCGEDLRSFVWELEQGEIITEGPQAFHRVTFSPDGKSILSMGRHHRHAPTTWDAETGKTKLKFHGHLMAVQRAYYSPDGKRVVTTSNDDTMRIWDAGTGKELLNLPFLGAKFLKFSPNGRAIAVRVINKNSKGGQIWDALDWTTITTPPKLRKYKRQRYADWLKANAHEVKKN